MAPFAFTFKLMDEPEIHTLEEEVLARMVGLVVFGVEQLSAMTKADGSLVTAGIKAPIKSTL